MVSGVFDILLGSEKGNCSLASFQNMEVQEFLLEAIYVLETVAPKKLNVDRFLPPTPVRIVVNHAMQDRTKTYSADFNAQNLKGRSNPEILENVRIKQELLPNMLNKGKDSAEIYAQKIINESVETMEAVLNKEVLRLTELKKVNKNIKKEEISLYKNEIDLLKKAIHSARLRLDALRFIVPGEE